MEHVRRSKTQPRAWGAVLTAAASVLLFVCFLHLLPHILSMLFMVIFALFPSGQAYLAPFGGYSGYFWGNLLPRLWEVLVSSYTWRWSWLWAMLGASIYLVQYYTWGQTALQTRWFRGITVAFALWYLLSYPIWADPFYGAVNTLLLVIGIALIWRLGKHFLSAEEVFSHEK